MEVHLKKRSFYKAEDYPEPDVTYDQLDEMLQNHPPAELQGYRPGPANDPERDRIAELFLARVYWDGPVSDELVAFFRKRMSRALDEVENTPAPESGVIVWKMYSSGTIVKSREGTFTFDCTEGYAPMVPILPEDIAASEKCFDEEGREVEGYLPPIAREMNTGPLPRPVTPIYFHSGWISHPKIYWTPAMRQQYARVIDAHFATHYHFDHFGYWLVAEVLKAGKTVVAPPDARQVCIGLGIQGAERIVTPIQDRTRFLESSEYNAGGVRIINFPGYQDEYGQEREEDRIVWRPKRILADVSKRTSHPENFTLADALEMYAYIVKLGGFNVFVNGEVRGCPYFYPWLVNLLKTEWQPDLCLAVFCFDGFRSHLTKLFDPIIIRLHELEFGHTYMQLWEEDPRPKFGYQLSGGDLFWGEHIHLVRNELSLTGASP